LYEYLNTGFASYKNVKIFPLACSDKNETREISIPTSEGNLGFGSASFVNKHIDFQSKSIECVRIDDLEIAKLNFIKIDVEGHEAEALEGLQ
jgi:FkbM family methyltransferase